MSTYKKLNIEQKSSHSVYVETTDKNGETLTVYVDSSTGENIINIFNGDENVFSYYLDKREGVSNDY